MDNRAARPVLRAIRRSRVNVGHQVVSWDRRIAGDLAVSAHITTLVGDGGGGLARRVRVEVRPAAGDRTQVACEVLRSGMPVGMFAWHRRVGDPVEVLQPPAQRVAVRRPQHRAPASMSARSASLPVRQHPGDHVLEALRAGHQLRGSMTYRGRRPGSTRRRRRSGARHVVGPAPQRNCSSPYCSRSASCSCLQRAVVPAR